MAEVTLGITASSIDNIKSQIDNITGTAKVGLRIKQGEIGKIQKEVGAIKATVPVSIKKINKSSLGSVQKAVSKLNPTTNVKVKADKSSFKDLSSKKISRHIGTVKVQGIDASRAIKNVRKNIQSEVQAGMSSIGNKTVREGNTVGSKISVAKKASAEAKEAAASNAKWAGSIKTVNTEMRLMGAKYEKVRKALPTDESTRVLQNRYRELEERAAELRKTPAKDGSDAQINKFMADVGKYSSQLDGIIAKEQRMKQVAADAASIEKQKVKAVKEAAKAYDSSTASIREMSQLSMSAQRTLARNPKLIGTEYEKSLKMIMGTLDSGQIISRDAFNNIKTQYQNIVKEATAAGKMGQSFAGRLKTVYNRLLSYGMISTVFFKISEGARSLYNNVVEIDTAMTQLRKVTDETNSTYDKFFDGVDDRAKSIGATMSDTINASADFARLGYDIDTASKMADAALVYKNVGDNITDISQASESLTSTIQAFKEFGIEATDAMEVVDRFNEVGKDYCPAA